MKTALVVTTIQAPNPVMRALAMAARQADADFFVIGDTKSPPDYALHGASYFSVADQVARFGRFAEELPTKHYVRKNLGYLAALDAGCDWIVETDDDNYPLPGFMQPPPAQLRVRALRTAAPWVNAYRHFSPSSPVWPRGYPLESLSVDGVSAESLSWQISEPVLVQGLADDNPDVDAVFRLTRSLPVRFDSAAQPLALDPGGWCPFNSQNTWFRRDVVALAYLPANCSFRMTDIWRSFVAQRCLWAMGQRLVFVAPTVRQERNEHNLLRDFSDEIPGYLNNDKIVRVLAECTLSGRPAEDLRVCYQALIAAGIFPEAELALVDSWLRELDARALRPAP